MAAARFFGRLVARLADGVVLARFAGARFGLTRFAAAPFRVVRFGFV